MLPSLTDRVKKTALSVSMETNQEKAKTCPLSRKDPLLVERSEKQSTSLEVTLGGNPFM